MQVRTSAPIVSMTAVPLIAFSNFLFLNHKARVREQRVGFQIMGSLCAWFCMQRTEHGLGAHRSFFGKKGPFWSGGQHCGLHCSFDVSVRARMAAERAMLLALGASI